MTDEELDRRNKQSGQQALGLGSRPYPVKGDGQPVLLPTKEELKAKAQRFATAQANNNQADPFRAETSGLLRNKLNPSGKDISDAEYENKVKTLSAPPQEKPPTPPAATTLPTTKTSAELLKTQAGRVGEGMTGFITGEKPTTAEGAPTGEVFSRRSASPGQRFMDRSGATQEYYAKVDGAKGFATGRTSSDGTRGGFVGAATDAEAARNMQARAEQDQNASYMAQSMLRGAELERDNRAAKLGIDRGTLDRMEGRNDTPAARQAAAMQQASSSAASNDPWSRPDDQNWWDGQRRQQEYEKLARTNPKAAAAFYEPVKTKIQAENDRAIAAGNNAVSREQIAATRMNAQADSEDKALQREQARRNADRSADQQDQRIGLEQAQAVLGQREKESNRAQHEAKMADENYSSVINDFINNTKDPKKGATVTPEELHQAIGIELASGDYDTKDFNASAAFKSGKPIPKQIYADALAKYKDYKVNGNKPWIGSNETHEAYVTRRKKEAAEKKKQQTP